MRLAIVACMVGATVPGCTRAPNPRPPRGDAAAPPAIAPPAATMPAVKMASPPSNAAAAPAREAAARPWQRDADWQLRRAVLAALKPSLRINQWREDCDLYVAVYSRRPAPVDFNLIVYACAGGREWELTRVTVAAGQPVAEYAALDAERLEGFLERVREDPRVSVVMRPAPGGAFDWREEVWYPEVVVRWEWY